MAVREPLYWTGTELKEMSTAQVTDWVEYIADNLWGNDPNVTLSIVSSGGNLGGIDDTRKAAGAYLSYTNTYPSEANTAEPYTVTVTHDKIERTSTVVGSQSDTNSTRWPVYWTGSEIRAMDNGDVRDTFIKPALTRIANGDLRYGTYTISTLAFNGPGFVEMSGIPGGTPVFTDTRADTAAYAAGSIPETQDQPTTITNYYLHRMDFNNLTSTSQPSARPLFINSWNNSYDLYEYDTPGGYHDIDAFFQKQLRSSATSATGYRITYALNSPDGNILGSGMVDTILNGSGNYQQRFVGADDYRAQEFPNGTQTTAGTHYLKINNF